MLLIFFLVTLQHPLPARLVNHQAVSNLLDVRLKLIKLDGDRPNN